MVFYDRVIVLDVKVIVCFWTIYINIYIVYTICLSIFWFSISISYILSSIYVLVVFPLFIGLSKILSLGEIIQLVYLLDWIRWLCSHNASGFYANFDFKRELSYLENPQSGWNCCPFGWMDGCYVRLKN